MVFQKKRLGLLLSSTNCVMEPEFYSMASKYISIHSSRMMTQAGGQATNKGALELAIGLEGAVRRLPRVELIAFGVTVSSHVKGPGYDQELIKRIFDESGILATTTSTAVVKALKDLNAHKISIVTPYRESMSHSVEKFLNENEFDVINRKTLGVKNAYDVGDTVEGATYQLTKEIKVEESDAVFISCTNLRTIGVIDLLEKELDKPVVSSNTATLWECLKLLKIKEPIKGFGTLLEDNL